MGSGDTAISDPLGVDTYALGINNSGQIVGAYENSKSQLFGYVYQNGTYTTLDVFGSRDATAQGINDAGQIVGRYTVGDVMSGFLYSNGPILQSSLPTASTTQGRL